MQLSSESRWSRWWLMLAVGIGVAALIWLHARVVRDYVGLLDQAEARVTADPATPLRQIIPARYADAQMWVRHALPAEAEGQARVRTAALKSFDARGPKSQGPAPRLLGCSILDSCL